jgi:hypothetical protein
MTGDTQVQTHVMVMAMPSFSELYVVGERKGFKDILRLRHSNLCYSRVRSQDRSNPTPPSITSDPPAHPSHTPSPRLNIHTTNNPIRRRSTTVKPKLNGNPIHVLAVLSIMTPLTILLHNLLRTFHLASLQEGARPRNQ